MQLDPAGKNHKLVKHAGSSDWAILQPLDFEFTSWDTTPQHNSLTELAFLYLASTMHAMMGGALIPDHLQAKVALQAIACVTQLDGLVVIEVSGKIATSDVHMFGANPKGTKNLQVWGEAQAVTVKKECKTGDKGT